VKRVTSFANWRFVALSCIRAYQRFISPHKGFHCAYRVCTGCASCSELGYRAVRRFGAVKGLAVLDGRLARCAEAARLMRAPRYRPRAQAGDCDPGCDFGDIGHCADCGGDCDWRRRKRDTGSEKPGKAPRVPSTAHRRRREADAHWRG
jgi:putative component of membrane protein insertase Oxa1/YidC/SpoIIIJ protein YidD